MNEVAFAHRWAIKDGMGQQLTALYQRGIPRQIIIGVMAYDAGIREALHEQHKRAIDEAKAQRGG